ncbi:MAG: thiamine-phosphate kinase [Pirellulales bacterium]|nr:thiamine-phosphate kinase [Pirellulales bacterium]
MEFDFIQWLRSRLPPHPRLRLGPGDDAALLRLVHQRECAVTVDLLSDGVDFDLASCDPRRIGHKSLAVNLSDLAAMAARPVAAVVALLLPQANNPADLARELYEGMLPLAERHDLCIAGGDTNTWHGPLVISITAIGEVPSGGGLLRSGARPGDRIILTGDFGGSILGRHLDVEPRVAEALFLMENFSLHAGIDCSDGLSLDLWRICQASQCGAVVDLTKVPIAAAAYKLAQRSLTREAPEFSKEAPLSTRDADRALEHALSDGEDFELILAVPPDAAGELISSQPLLRFSLGGKNYAGPLLSDIGEFVAEPGLWSGLPNGPRTTLPPRGYEHR